MTSSKDVAALVHQCLLSNAACRSCHESNIVYAELDNVMFRMEIIPLDKNSLLEDNARMLMDRKEK